MELTQVLTALNLSRKDLGVAEDADEATVLTAIAEHQSKPGVPEGHVVLSQETVTQLTSDAAKGAAAAEELRVNRFETAFDAAQGQGKIVLAQKETFREMFDLDADKTLKLLDGLQPVINMTPAGVGGSGADLDESARALASQFSDSITPMGVDSDQLRLHAAAVEIERAKNVTYEKALELAEQGVTV